MKIIIIIIFSNNFFVPT